jgi:hypothetical protein
MVGDSPYGTPRVPDAYSVAVPAGIHVRLLAASRQPVAGTGHVWHGAPDGGACFATPESGSVHVSHAELPNGGAAALKFAADGTLVDAYTILTGTRVNCAGGPTPWGTWLSCKELSRGQVRECDPQQPGQGIARPAMGRFSHEAVAVDPDTGWVERSARGGGVRSGPGRHREPFWGCAAACTMGSQCGEPARSQAVLHASIAVMAAR